MMKISKVLEKAADLIEKKGHCKNLYAIDKNGCSVVYTDKRAVSFCVEGAISRISNKAKDMIGWDAMQWFGVYIKGNVVKWNDAKRRTKEQVVTKLRKASEAAKKEGV